MCIPAPAAGRANAFVDLTGTYVLVARGQSLPLACTSGNAPVALLLADGNQVQIPCGTGELSTVAKEVTMICANDKMLDSPLGHKLQQAKNVKIMKDCEIVEVQGDEYARKLIVKDKAGKLNEYRADGMFVEKALTPNTSMVKDLVKLDEQGRIIRLYRK